MIPSYNVILLVMLVLAAIVSLRVRDLLSASMVFGIYSFLICLLWAEMGAVDVAFTEAAVGAGVSAVFFIATVYHTRRRVKQPRRRTAMNIAALIAVTLTGAVLIYGVSDFPHYGDPKSPANGGALSNAEEPVGGRSVSETFIEETYELTKVPNMVTAVLADYRGYDTMFEVVVVFAAGMAIFAIIRVVGNRDPKVPLRKQSEDELCNGDHSRIIVGMTCRILIPVIQLFGLYVIAHGHYSPGGGFQGGVIIGASFILLAIAKNLTSALAWFSEQMFMNLACIGILIYAGFGVLCQILGGNFLDYTMLAKILPDSVSVQMARSHAMLGVEVGVAFTVTAIMFAIYANLSSRGEMKGGL